MVFVTDISDTHRKEKWKQNNIFLDEYGNIECGTIEDL